MARYRWGGVAGVICALVACGDESATGITVPLSGTGTTGTVYQLRDARFRIVGPTTVTVDASSTAGSTLSASVPAGGYTVELLAGWQVVRLPDGAPMIATLASPNPQMVAVASGMRASVQFVFDVSGELVVMTGDADLEIGFEVREPDASVMDAGMGCMDGEVRPCGIDTGECQLGAQHCMGGTWLPACMGGIGPSMELCSGRDEDCDGVFDEGACADAGVVIDAGPGCMDGATRPCGASGVGACTFGTESCMANTWVGCTAVLPSAELCSSADEDCDGAVDEGFDCAEGTSRACTTLCGTSGTQDCTLGMCTWGACTPPPETCNGADDDCDMTVDEECM